MGKRIVIFIPKLYIGGGAERSSLALGQALSKNHEVMFVTQHAGDITFSEAGSIYSWQQSEHGVSKILDVIPSALKLKKFCETNNIDVVISNMPRANTITILAKFFGNKTKNILVTRNANTGKKFHALVLPLFNFADKNVAVSHGTEFVLNRSGVTNTTTIYNAFDFEQMNKKILEDILPEHQHYFKDGIIFFTIGRLHKQKGYIYLLDAFKKVVPQKNDAKLLIAFGGGPDREHIEHLIKTLGLEQHVFLLGTVKNVFPYLREADAFVLASLWEGLPTVLIEAQFAQTPIISTDCMSGPREILTTKPYSEKLTYPYRVGENTLVTPPNISEEKFTEEFVSSALLINKKPQGKTLRLEQYSIETVSQEWDNLLNALWLHK